MKLTLHTFLTLDGVMQGPGAADEDTTDGFAYGGWLVPFVDEDFGEIVNGWFGKAEAILLGHSTYTMMQAYWSQVTDPDNVVAAKLNGLPKYVAATSLGEPMWHNSAALDDDAVGRVRQLKEKPGGELQVHGSWQLAHALHHAGLIDQYRLLVFPVTVGAGKRLFGDDAPPRGYTLVDSATTSSGVAYSALQPRPFESGRVGVAEGHEAV